MVADIRVADIPGAVVVIPVAGAIPDLAEEASSAAPGTEAAPYYMTPSFSHPTN